MPSNLQASQLWVLERHTTNFLGDEFMKKRTLTKGMLMTALVCGFVQWGGTAVHAEELQEFTLDPMVVTAQRMETRDLDTPAMTSVITAADIEKTGATTVMEALRFIPGFTDNSYSGNGDDQGSSRSRVLVRGFDKATLVMVNGAPINVMNYGSTSGIPVEAIERIEVVKGANSVLYGAEAMSGVVNIITKKGVGELKTTVSGTTGNYLKKWNTTFQGDGYIVSLGKDYIDRFSPSNKANNNKSTGMEYTDNSKYQRDNAFTSLALSPNLQLNWIYQKADPKTTIRDAVTDKFKRAYYEYKDTKNALSLIYDDKENRTKTVLAYNEVKMEAMDMATPGSVLKISSDTNNYEASNLYFDTQKQWDFGKKDNLIAGLTMKHEKYDQIFTDTVDNERNSYAIYASYTKNFSDKFSAIIGVRGQYYASTDFDRSYDEILPQLQTVYKLSDDTTWYTNIAKAFELPAINAHEYYAAGAKQKNAVEPQSGWNYETGIKKVTDTTATKLAVYHMDFKNKFAWELVPEVDPVNKVQVNKGEFRNTGVELEYKKVFNDNWSYTLGAAYQNPESYEEDDGEWLQETARFTLNAGIDYKFNKFNTSVNCYYLSDREDAYYRHDGTKASTNGVDHKLKDRLQVNASLSYKPTDYQAITFNMYNLLDRDDVISSYERYDLPYNWTLTYTHTF